MIAIFAFVFSYFVLLIALSALVRPQRKRLAVLAHELLSEDIDEDRRVLIGRLLATAYAMRMAPTQFLATCIALLIPSDRFDREARDWAQKSQDLIEDGRWFEMFECHSASAAAANPIFGALAYAARGVFKLKARHYARRFHGNQKTYEFFGELKAI